MFINSSPSPPPKITELVILVRYTINSHNMRRINVKELGTFFLFTIPCIPTYIKKEHCHTLFLPIVKIPFLIKSKQRFHQHKEVKKHVMIHAMTHAIEVDMYRSKKKTFTAKLQKYSNQPKCYYILHAVIINTTPC